jgi:hypothetical protein
MGYASNPPNAPYFETLSTFPSPQALDLLQQWGTKFVLVNQKLYQNGSVFWRLWQTWASLAPAIQKSDRLNEVAVLGDVHVYELHSREIQPMSEELIPNPGFESGTTTEIQGWTWVGQPKIDHSGTQAHAGASSCLVTPSDYFVSDPVSIKPGRCYLLQAFGRRGKNKAAYLRLKIVWLDALRHPLDPSTTSVRVVELNDQWEPAREASLAPQEGHYATIYAVTQSGSGRLDDYSFRELSSDCDPTLIAIPNPAVLPPTAKRGTSSISWDSHSGAGSHVGVSIDGHPETRFAEGPVGMRLFDIQTASQWEFRLYGDSGTAPIKTVTVASQPIPTLSASSVVFESPSALGKTTISWNMPNHSEAEVWVSQDGGPEQLFVRGASGSQEAPWIARGSTYEFKLYAMLPKRKLIDKLRVRETGPSP